MRLGSVRQLADSSGQVQLARAYTPYGEPLWTNGTANTRYAFTGEDYDPTVGLVFLRARYMNPALSIFLARDPWVGYEQTPGTYNGFNYTMGNPINTTDPSGLCRFPDMTCYALAVSIMAEFQVKIDLAESNDNRCDLELPPGETMPWIVSELETVRDALKLAKAFLDSSSTTHFYGTVGEFYEVAGKKLAKYTIKRVRVNMSAGTDATQTIDTRNVWLGDTVVSEVTTSLFAQPNRSVQIGQLLHEIFHAYDYNVGLVSSDPAFSSSSSLKFSTQIASKDCGPTNYACTDQFENFAESTTVYALEWLRRNKDLNGLASSVYAAYPDIGAHPSSGRESWGNLRRPIEFWDDLRMRENFLNQYFGLTVRP